MGGDTEKQTFYSGKRHVVLLCRSVALRLIKRYPVVSVLQGGEKYGIISTFEKQKSEGFWQRLSPMRIKGYGKNQFVKPLISGRKAVNSHQQVCG